MVGDSKMSARTTWGTIVAGQDYCLTPLADKKDEPELWSQLLEERMLKAFDGITLLIWSQGGQRLTLLLDFMPLHARILALLGLAPALFADLQAA